MGTGACGRDSMAHACGPESPEGDAQPGGVNDVNPLHMRIRLVLS